MIGINGSLGDVVTERGWRWLSERICEIALRTESHDKYINTYYPTRMRTAPDIGGATVRAVSFVQFSQSGAEKISPSHNPVDMETGEWIP